MNSGVWQYRTPGDELRHKHHWKRSRMTRERWQVTTQESLDGIREKAMRIASLDELEEVAVQEEGPVQEEQRTTRPIKPPGL